MPTLRFEVHETYTLFRIDNTFEFKDFLTLNLISHKTLVRYYYNQCGLSNR